MLTIVGTLLSLAFMLWKEHYANSNTPDAKRLALSAQIAVEMVRNDADAANVRLADQLRVLSARNQQRQNAVQAASDQAVHAAV